MNKFYEKENESGESEDLMRIKHRKMRVNQKRRRINQKRRRINLE